MTPPSPSPGPAPVGAKPTSARIPSLDGLRALSIGMVILGHASRVLETATKGWPFAWGELGVTVFFVISGFLITSLLLAEQRKHGRISLGQFYLRRTIRIFPAMYVYCGVVIALSIAGWIALRPGDAPSALFYVMNFRADRAWWLGHTWSLSVEEQFYLLWPATLVLAGVAGATRVAFGVMIVAPLLRVAVLYGWPAQRPLIDQAFPLVFDRLATGCLLALLRDQLWSDQRYRRLLSSRAFALVPLVVVVVYFFTPRFGLLLLVGWTIIQVGIALIVDRVTRFPDDAVGRLLNSRPASWMGVMSYSLYLWQQLFLSEEPHWFTRFPLNLALAFAAAAASYYLVEQPALRLRERMEERRRSREALARAA